MGRVKMSLGFKLTGEEMGVFERDRFEFLGGDV